MKKNISFTIPLQPYTKKNSSQIRINQRTGKRYIAPSPQFITYQNNCAYFIKALNISEAINVKALFFMSTKRKVDLTNLNEALHDILVHYHCLEDDNSKIIVSTDGSRVLYDKENPRTEITISFYDN